MTESFHILHPTQGRDEPIPVTFYLSEEILSDDTITAETLADLLKNDLALAIEHHRRRRMGGSEGGNPEESG